MMTIIRQHLMSSVASTGLFADQKFHGKVDQRFSMGRYIKGLGVEVSGVPSFSQAFVYGSVHKGL